MKKKRHSETEMVKAIRNLKNDALQVEVEVQRDGCEPGKASKRV